MTLILTTCASGLAADVDERAGSGEKRCRFELDAGDQ
jgi:hypothetical protein